MPSSPSSPTSRLPRGVTVTLLVYRLLLRVYPAGFRKEYGPALLQVVRHTCRDAYTAAGMPGLVSWWFSALGDLLTGALQEYALLLRLRWYRAWVQYRLRSSVLAVFWAYGAFVLAGVGLRKMTEAQAFALAARTHAAIGISFQIVLYGSLVAVLAVLSGCVPLILAALRAARAARRVDIPLLLLVPVLALAVLAGYLALARHLTAGQTRHLSPLDVRAALGLVAVLVLAAFGSTLAVTAAIARSNPPLRLLSVARMSTGVAALAMAIMCVATLLWGLSIRTEVGSLFHGHEGFLATATALNWAGIVVVMILSSFVALASAVRSFTPRPDPNAPLLDYPWPG